MHSLQIAEYPELVSELPLGKTLPNARYLHTCALSVLPEEYSHLVDQAAELAGASPEDFNVVKFEVGHPRVSLLNYPSFFEDGFPVLQRSWTVDLAAQSSTTRSYSAASNPPVLHRKEALLPREHPMWPEFRRLTHAAEEAGLLEDIRDIGHADGWRAKLARVGLVVRGNELAETDRLPAQDDVEIARHRTALVRYSLSAPMQQLWKHGYLNGGYSVFDYGCGRGDDVRALQNRELEARGWDPHFAAENSRLEADLVNLGFVLNVIEDLNERDEALRSAWRLTKKLLAVAVMLSGRSSYERFRLYRDGVVTRRGTFQKYFRQNELRQYIAETIGQEPVAIAPGVFFVFKAEHEEQSFLAKRQLSRPPTTRLARPLRRRPPVQRPPKPTKWHTHRELIGEFWERCEDLGRIPELDEFTRAVELRELVGTPKTVYRRCAEQFGEEAVVAAREARGTDRLVYLALNLFERRHSMNKLPEAVQRDVRSFWGSYAVASEKAKSLLFSTGSPEVVFNACRQAAEQGLGFLDGQHSLTIHSSARSQLGAALRVYLECASRIYGDLDQADLIKIHITSNKVSLMKYDDFEGRPVPLLLERTKILLGEADYDVYVYEGEYEPKPLYDKGRYLPEGFPKREEQLLFDRALGEVLDLEPDDHGPSASELEALLEVRGLQIRGFQLTNKSEPRRTPTKPESSYDHLLREVSDGPAAAVASRSLNTETGSALGMTILEAINAVLAKSDRPLSAVEIHKAISREGLFEFKAKDPKGVISSTIGKHLRSAGPHAIEKVGAGTFKAV